MIRRLLSLLLLAWTLGFAWFALAMPRPAAPAPTDAIVVLTGGPGRIDRGLDLLQQGQAKRLFISGVDRDVTAAELAREYDRPIGLFACCVALGFEAVDTRSNADEVAGWVERRGYRSIRLVTTDWHMRRAAFELTRALPARVAVTRDAVPSSPNLRTLFREYHKWLLGAAGRGLGL